jgi:hypothetical protein
MPSLSGALGGAATGAQIGAIGGPVGMAIGAGIGGIAGLFTGGKSKLQKQLESKIDPSLNNLMNWSGQSRDKQNAMYDLALPNLTAASNYYQGILSNDNPTALNSVLGPQRTAVNDQFQGLLNQIGMFAPRGGGRNQRLANAGFDRNRALMELIPQARAQAAAGALQTGQATGNQAIQWGNLSTEQASAVLQAITSMLTGQMADKARKDQGMTGVLQKLGPLLTDIMGQIKAGKGGGGGSTAGLKGPDYSGIVLA